MWEAVGISVDSSKDGWRRLIAFANERDKENRTAIALERSSRKRVQGTAQLDMFN